MSMPGTTSTNCADCAGLTDVGRVRKQNEDSILVRPDVGLFVVADGMGGHQAGEVASRLAVETIAEYFDNSTDENLPEPAAVQFRDMDPGAQRLGMGIVRANIQVCRAAQSGTGRAGMGTTIAAVHVSPDGSVHIGHIGDSRVYRISNGEIEQVTQDHSFVNQIRWSSPGVEPDVLAHLPKNVITRALGLAEDTDVELRSELSLPGDVYLVCSDGLSGFVSSEQMLAAVEKAPTLEAAAHELIDAANRGGGKDNISVVIVRVEPPESTIPETVSPTVTVCPACGVVTIPGNAFCVECGHRLVD